MENLVIIAAAIGLVVVLGILAKMHRQNDELLTVLKDVTKLKKDTRSLTDRTLKIEGMVEFVYQKQNQPERPEDISWKGWSTKGLDINNSCIVTTSCLSTVAIIASQEIFKNAGLEHIWEIVRNNRMPYRPPT